MALILCIDTSLEQAAVGVYDDSAVVALRTNDRQTDHASWIHTAIADMFREADINLKLLDAVAVVSGPGSYTGLRVAMATAKGLCYALKIPLITEATLRLTASRALLDTSDDLHQHPLLVCPMIDARRMEVFTALYNASLHEYMTPAAIVLNEMSFSNELQTHKVIFCGNGSMKWKELCNHPNALFHPANHKLEDLATAAKEKFRNGDFSDLAYAEPDYLKNAYTGK